MKPNALCTLILLVLCATSRAQDELLREVQARREMLASKMEPSSIFLLFSAPIRYKSNDIPYPYRQNSNFYYLTGITQPNCALIVFAGKEAKAILFAPPKDLEEEIWTGRRLSVDQIHAISGISWAYSSEVFLDVLGFILSRALIFFREHGLHHHPFFSVPEDKAIVYLELSKQPECEGLQCKGAPGFEEGVAEELTRYFPLDYQDGFDLLADLRLCKSEYEIQCLRKAIAITEQAMQSAIREVKPGAWEYEIEAALEYIYKKNNAEAAFEQIIASGPNSIFLHYTKGERRMEDGDILLMDVGASYLYYSADITRTIPVNGRFTAAQREIYEVVLKAQQDAIAAVKPGMDLMEIHRVAVDSIKEGLLRLHLITDFDSDQYRLYFMHKTSHWLGLDTHDPALSSGPLKPGMVFTIEPGIYISSDIILERAREEFGEAFTREIEPYLRLYDDIGVRIEDDVLVTENRAEV